MPTKDRIPVLVYDDGTPTGATTVDRALDVASRIVLVTAHRSTNLTRNVAAADHADIPVEVVNLPARQGIRHALTLCAEHDIYLAYVPRPDTHPGEQLRKIIQAAAATESNGLPVLAVRIVHPDTPAIGPVVEIDPADADAGFASLFAAGLAATTGNPLHILRLAGDRTDAELRAADALQQARQLIVDNDIPTYDHTTSDDPIATAIEFANGASAIVIGLGGMTIAGRKPTAPDELPDSVLRSSDGHLAHELARHANCDLIIVLDTIEIHHGSLTQAAAVTAAIAAIAAMAAGTQTAGTTGLAITGAAVAASATGYAALQNRTDEPG